MTIKYKCRNCGEEFMVHCSPLIPARTWGPPENCHPAEGGEIDPDECPNCGEDVDREVATEQAAEESEEAATEREIEKEEDR